MGKQVDKSIIGQKFNNLLVLNYEGSKKQRSFFKCKCDCGNETIISYTAIKQNKTKTCGCGTKNYFHDMTGQQYNGIKILQFIGKNKYKSYEYLVQCHCGKQFVTEGNDLKTNRKKSCGCRLNCDQIINANYLQSVRNNIFCEYKNKAKERKYSFSLTKEQVFNLINKNCVYCNSEPLNVKKLYEHPEYYIRYNGIDRIDNTKGYSIDNVVTCCKYCNQAKHSMTLNYFKHWINLILKAKENKIGIWENDEEKT